MDANDHIFHLFHVDHQVLWGEICGKTIGVCFQDNLESRLYEDQCYQGGEGGKNRNYHFPGSYHF